MITPDFPVFFMKRLLLTVHKFFPDHRAGTEVLTLKVAQELMMRGYKVQVVTANPPDRDARCKGGGPETSDYEYEGVPVHVVEESLRQKHNSFRSEFFNPDVAEDFRKVLADFAPDVVHAFHFQNLSSSIIDEVLARKVPVVFSATDFWFICPIVQLRRTDGALCRGPEAFAKNCLTCYTPELFPPVSEFVEAFDGKYPKLKEAKSGLPAPISNMANSALYAAYISGKIPSAMNATAARPKVLRDAANRLSAITVPTKLMNDLFVENGISPGIIHHVPFGIDTAPLIGFQTKTPSEELRIGYVGALAEHKGVDLLVRAFLGLPADAKAELAIYGDLKQFPDYGEFLQKLANDGSPNTSKITFEGSFPNSELGTKMSSIDVLVVPSRWYENTPLVIQSALACKTPVVATNLGGMSELIKHRRNGLLFDLNSESSLRAQFQSLLEEPELLGRLRANILPERTISQMVDQLECIYAAALGSADESAKVLTSV
jgi:glycosyltransferase involved in cell wall biosynthesis